MVAMLLGYDAAHAVIATLDYCLARDDAGEVIGLIDFEAHEAAGGAMTDIWNVSNAAGSGTWPEFLGAGAHDFRVEIGPDGRIAALVHKVSGFRRERVAIQAAIDATPIIDGARDIRAIVGGPHRPLALDPDGRTTTVDRTAKGTPPHLPILGR